MLRNVVRWGADGSLGQPYAFRQAGLGMGVFLLVGLTITVLRAAAALLQGIFVGLIPVVIGRLDYKPNSNKLKAQRCQFVSSDGERVFRKARIDCDFCKLSSLLAQRYVTNIVCRLRNGHCEFQPSPPLSSSSFSLFAQVLERLNIRLRILIVVPMAAHLVEW